MKRNINENAFPLETLFPGIHAARPDIAAHEAETFLEHGSKPAGFNLQDPATRAQLLGSPDFIAFQIAPLQSDLAARVAALPPDWQDRPETYTEAEAINTAIEQHYRLAPRFYVSLNDRREAWVGRNR